MSTWHGVMADGEEFMRWKISTNDVDGYKTDTKCAHSVHGRPTLKDEERFSELVGMQTLREISLWANIYSEPFIEKHAISTELCNVNREKHKLKSHCLCRRDREPSRIPIRSVKSLRNKSRRVREFVYAPRYDQSIKTDIGKPFDKSISIDNFYSLSRKTDRKSVV